MRLRAAVVGVGYLGRFHAEKYAAHPGVELVAVVDVDGARAAEIGGSLAVDALTDHRALVGRIDCASVAVSTQQHYTVARDLLEAGIDVLVEKPLTVTVAEGRALVDAAERGGRILQVGHLERFNPAIRALADIITRPRFIECHRLAPFRERGTDVNVVLDLMIHDLDIVQSIVGSGIAAIDAIGTPVFSDEIDIANARLRFDNGCVANATASRVSLKTERKLRIFQDDAYLSLDLQQKLLTVIRKQPAGAGEARLPVSIEEQSFEPGDALRAEIEAFLASCRGERAVVVSGEDGMRALQTAVSITAAVRNGHSGGQP